MATAGWRLALILMYGGCQAPACGLTGPCTPGPTTLPPHDTGAALCADPVIVDPAPDAADVYARGTVEATFTEPEADATLTLVDADGHSVSGSTTWRDTTLVFSSSNGLSPDARYTATVDRTCGDAFRWNFTTSDVGTAVSATSLIGDAYSADLTSARFLQPAGIGSLLAEYFTTALLVGVRGVDGAGLDLIVASSTADDPLAQDPCVVTTDLPAVDFSKDPYFEAGPFATTLPISGHSLAIDRLVVTGSFAPDASTIEGMTLTGTFDTRPLVPLLDPNGADSAVCDLAASIGVSCEPCPDGTGTFCLAVDVDRITAIRTGTSLVDVAEPCAR